MKLPKLREVASSPIVPLWMISPRMQGFRVGTVVGAEGNLEYLLKAFLDSKLIMKPTHGSLWRKPHSSLSPLPNISIPTAITSPTYFPSRKTSRPNNRITTRDRLMRGRWQKKTKTVRWALVMIANLKPPLLRCKSLRFLHSKLRYIKPNSTTWRITT